MIRKILFSSIIVFLFLFYPLKTYSSSDYVLPYPGFMPGSSFYPIFEYADLVKGFFAFGDFASFSYSLSQSDKYLVEAKVLFEYNQYPLAIKSLKKSDQYLIAAKSSLSNAKTNRKNISQKHMQLRSAEQKHTEVLDSILPKVPKIFTWEDEKKDPVLLQLESEILKSIEIRK